MAYFFILGVAFFSFTFNLVGYPLNVVVIPYVPGLIITAVGTVLSVLIFVRANCIRKVWYCENDSDEEEEEMRLAAEVELDGDEVEETER